MDKDLIRALIRDVIAEEVKAVKTGKSPAAAPHAVRITSDADLAAFAKDVLRLAADPQIRAAIEAGRHPFHLAGTTPSAALSPAAATGQSHRVDKGVVTETVIAKLAKGVSRLILAPGVSITPLARDKAKARNISVERIGQ
ncbi:hypothetical protein [Dongia rigui]|uniref:Uncharacterized protein n=1 Tax=Dongia rigui TaxID=940149 RepID=A0ABU5E4A7_9PROT|nr:hypothetical protein [Dongia rigui]MDY0873753.1 hypothetical protein [Dongia rigui]